MFHPDRPRGTVAEAASHSRRGAFMVLAFFCLIVTLAFVAFSIDTGNIALNKTIMQNAVDSAALAAAMEITSAVENAPPGEEDPTAYAREQAKAKAVEVAGLNGVFVDANYDVEFGLRSFNEANEQFEIQWGVQPANAVKVIARRDNDDSGAPDAKLPMMFAGVLGDDTVRMQAEAIAYIESRDIAVVLDFSGSMRYDSLFRSDSIEKLGANAIRDNLRQMYWELEFADGDLGTLDHTDPENSASDLTPEVKYLVVNNDPQQVNDPEIDVTFKYNEIEVSSDSTYKTIRLLYDDGDGDEDTWDTSTHSGLNATSGTYTGNGGYWDENVAGVEVVVDIPGSGPISKTATLNQGSGVKTSVTINQDGDEAEVTLDGSSLDKIKLWYTDGSTDVFNNPSGQHELVTGDSGKVIEDVKVWADNGGRKKLNNFEVFPGYEYTAELMDTNENVKDYFNLDGLSYPFASGSWDSYIDYVRVDSEINRGSHREMYGGITFVHYTLEQKPYHSQTPELAKTSHFPYHAVREGNELFVDFLSDLGFGDHVGLVSYDQYRRTEEILNEDGQALDISADPLGDHYQAIKTIMDYKQASHYYSRTNIGGGIRQSREMIDSHSRDGSRPTILLMTDGNANVYENQNGQNSLQSGFSSDSYYQMPAGFAWSMLDYPDGTSFYINDDGSENARSRIYALSQAYRAVEEGITVHTLAVGAGADRDLMKAIAFLGGGEFISVEGDLSVDNLMDEVEAGFYRIAALVPPARLADPAEATP